MAPDAAECCATSHHCRAARRSPRWCAAGCRAPSCAVGGTPRSAVPAHPTARRSIRHNQLHLSHLSSPKYRDRSQALTDPRLRRMQYTDANEMERLGLADWLVGAIMTVLILTGIVIAVIAWQSP